MFDFLGGALRQIRNSLNVELRDFKRALMNTLVLRAYSNYYIKIFE